MCEFELQAFPILEILLNLHDQPELQRQLPDEIKPIVFIGSINMNTYEQYE
jgi:hypothetical protein